MYPDDTFALQYCAYQTHNGVITFLPFVPVTFTTYTTDKSGFHTHEGIGSLPRPQAVFLGPTSTATSATGCITIMVQLPGIAGWYTFTGTSPGLNTKGINFYAKYYTLRHATNTNANLEPYPDNSAINVPQSLRVDARHFSGGFSRFIDENTFENFIGMSTTYRVLTSSRLGVIDRMDISRCSLPDGGIADNDLPQFAPGVTVGFEWQARAFEEHARGTECDVLNPQTTSMANSVLAIAAMQANACTVGRFSPTGDSLADPTNYWLGQDKFHVTCALGKSLRSKLPQ
jgi:hypothetical protein